MPKKRRAPAIEFAASGRRLGEAFEIEPLFRGVGKRTAAREIVDIGGAKAGRRMVETDIADKAKLGGAIGKLGGRHVIAETSVVRPLQPHSAWA